MAEASSKTPQKGGEQSYILNRDSEETARLNLQHYVLTKSYGFLIHPSIPNDKPNLRIVDFATGTGIWPMDTSKILPDTALIDGFDISAAQFPPQTNLPKNVHLYQHNILKPLDEKYHGIYDIAAVRALVVVLADHEWEMVISNIVKYLKPGGYFQWIDPDLSPAGWKAITIKPGASTAGIQKGIKTCNAWAKFIGRNLDTSSRLPELFRSNGLEVTKHEVMPMDGGGDADLRTRGASEIADAMAGMFVKYSQLEGSGLAMEEAVKIGQEMQSETASGEAYARMDLNIVIGRKPL